VGAAAVNPDLWGFCGDAKTQPTASFARSGRATRQAGPAHEVGAGTCRAKGTPIVNDRPDSPVTDASTYSIFVGARSNQDLIHVDDAGIAWDWDSRDEP
jgi:hypothetical protein